MENSELVASGLIGMFLPLAVSLLKQVHWSRPAKLALTVLTSLVLAIVVTVVEGGFNLGVLANFGVIFGTASTVYTALLEQGPVEAKLRRVNGKRK